MEVKNTTMLSEVVFTLELQPLVYYQSTNLAIDLSHFHAKKKKVTVAQIFKIQEFDATDGNTLTEEYKFCPFFLFSWRVNLGSFYKFKRNLKKEALTSMESLLLLIVEG